MNKIAASARDALAGHLHDGMSIAAGGFGLSGIPVDLIEAVRDSGVRDLTIVSNNMGIDGVGLGLLLENDQVATVIASYVGENRLFAEQHLSGRVAVEFAPQGTLAERLRAGGAGIPAFYTRTGIGTLVAEGKPHASFDGREYVLERGIVVDLALVRAHLADEAGNLVFRKTARNFNPVVASAGRFTVAEAETILVGEFIEADRVHTPGIFVDTVAPASLREKKIEQRTVRPRGEESTDEERDHVVAN